MYPFRRWNAVQTIMRNLTRHNIKQNNFLASVPIFKDNPIKTITNQARINTKEPTWSDFPFQNLVLEGGGAKGEAYVGVIKYLEDNGVMNNFSRFAGSSAGAMTATGVALGYTSHEMAQMWEQDINHMIQDSWLGKLSFFPNFARYYGCNKGERLYDFLGTVVAAKSPTSNPDMTFEELYKHNNAELCIVVINVNRMCIEYCHPKTTPNLSIRSAMRMSMALPVVLSPVKYNNDLYTDGGVVCNYPIHCFDGWYLSMKEEDIFFERIARKTKYKSITDGCFDGVNPKTLGCLVYSESENDIMRYDLDKRQGVLEPPEPSKESKLYKAHKRKMTALRPHEKSVYMLEGSIDAFLHALQKNNKGDLRSIGKNELINVFEDIDTFTEEHRRNLFEDDSPEEVFLRIDKNNDGKIDVREICNYFQDRGIVLHRRMDGCSREEINNGHEYFFSVLANIQKQAMVRFITHSDVQRTIGINVGHVTTKDFTLEKADKEFLHQRGYNATEAFVKTLNLNIK